MDSEQELNSKIMKVTMTIREKYPELHKYIDEMQETIPDEKNPDMDRKKLETYYHSLCAMVDKYVLEHPEIEK